MSLALIIEDELVIAFSIEGALGELGYSFCEIATSVEEAISAAERRCPDLIVADHRIVGGTGTEAVLRICAHKTIPVVFVSASGPEIREVLPDALIVDKPFAISSLQGAIEKALERPFRHSPGQEGPEMPAIE
ncbi:response regulator [Erythrobacter vulgaris]|uniref:Response regulator n=1 Tax=Qipengyuania vulgaris TaxID=291985 RepID=A0A844XUI2_9SPHN|nr:response regulator [Qipengyuania vulgaris]MXO48632.1 response regulator [Qipengyuania vulgaris]